MNSNSLTSNPIQFSTMHPYTRPVCQIRFFPLSQTGNTFPSHEQPCIPGAWGWGSSR